MFQYQWHDEIDDAHGYEMKCNFVGAKHLGCYTQVCTRPNLAFVTRILGRYQSNPRIEH